MAMMCKMNGECTGRKGMCIHEKMMAGIMLVAMAVGGYMYMMG